MEHARTECLRLGIVFDASVLPEWLHLAGNSIAHITWFDEQSGKYDFNPHSDDAVERGQWRDRVWVVHFTE